MAQDVSLKLFPTQWGQHISARSAESAGTRAAGDGVSLNPTVALSSGRKEARFLVRDAPHPLRLAAEVLPHFVGKSTRFIGDGPAARTMTVPTGA